MRALKFYGRRDIRLETCPSPDPGPGEVRVRAALCVLAQSIVDFNVEGHMLDLGTPHPVTGIGTGYIMGQQFGGVIDAVGPGVDPSRIGQRVGIAPGRGCGACRHCLRGQVNYCDTLIYYGLVGAHGGMAEHCVVGADNAVPVPNDSIGCLLEPLLVVHNLIRKVASRFDGQPVFCLGAGPIGLCAAAVARDLFGQEVILHDILPGRLERARAAGFRVATEAEQDALYPIVLDCAGTNPETGGSAMLDALQRVDKGGILGIVGTYLRDETVSPIGLLVREVTITTSFAYAQADLDLLTPKLGALGIDLQALSETLTLPEAVDVGLMRGEVDRDGFTVLLVAP